MSRLLHYQKYKLHYEIAVILAFFIINGAILATSVIMEDSRDGSLGNKLWEPFVWEYSSAIGTLLLLYPIFKLIQRFPIFGQAFVLTLLIYLLASIVFSLLHVGIMVGIRHIVYWLVGSRYSFGDVWFELLYEYRKDLMSFIFIITAYYSYQFISSRLIGEANPVGDSEDSPNNQSCDRLLVKKLGKEFIIKVEDVEWLESSGNYVNLHLGGRIYPTRATLSGLVAQISEKGFCRIHRSHAVNLDAIDSITPLNSGDSEVKLTNGKVLNLSRRYKDELKARLH
ncbi:LytTR family transcriptional regulator [Aliikangiella marina]|uniref:LytTR family transcriptional regulator n=1 Tax=Aliikangiella marina TaxID=1712262 RepID=A0A545T4M1_9GAMM|nr:LytTR family DNA-binding domain-containing protein [Aliikangiella marina]TQV72169.1 LytTR family transcriptional regulator [Aliikangiella marina]